ncbi:MAG: hypothetical protein Q8R13_00385 [bacterium]|nr:hypothetical protein [bacterium]MDZ4295854.1 hypothetical protein [Patescibacteria group bacterium]MDZ4295859.1 hypothetical protein [Patescibacteria group bacterium]
MHGLDGVVGYLQSGANGNDARIRGRHASQKKLEELGLRGKTWPRYQAAYEVIAGAIPDFTWQAADHPPYGSVVEFAGYPTVDGRCPTLADLVVWVLRQPGEPVALRFDAFPPRIAERLAPILEVGSSGREFARMLLDLPAVLPRFEVAGALARWIERALCGEPSTIFTTVCPDYAVDDEGRYTFESLGDGIGVVAQRALLVLPALWNFSTHLGLNVAFVVAMADSEAYVPANCARVGLTREEFLERLGRSLEAVRKALPEEMTLETVFITSLAGPYGSWAKMLEAAQTEADAGRWTGVYPFSETDLQEVLAARRSLYERWYGPDVDVREALRSQMPEYMAAARVAEENYPNVLIVGTDAASMAPFNHGLADHVRAVVYLRSGSY